MSKTTPYLKTVASAFQKPADDYEGWLADNPAFESEISALSSMKKILAEPRLETGVGPGVFAERDEEPLNGCDKRAGLVIMVTANTPASLCRENNFASRARIG